MAVPLFITAPALAQDSQGGPPTWKSQVPLGDGRVFVTDGSFLFDAAHAKPAELPDVVLAPAAATVERYLAAALENEYRLDELRRGEQAGTYVAPSGVVLSAAYVDYVRRAVPARSVRLRMKGDLEPVVVLLDGAGIGLIMPMKR